MFNNLQDLIKKVKDEAQKILENQIAEKVIELEQKHIDSDVYSVYDPVMYKRSYRLKDRDSFKITKLPDGISIRNVTTHIGIHGEVRDIPDTIEYGRNYDFSFEYSDKGRPFVENTREELESGKEHIKIMKEELMRKGFDVK